MKAEWVEEKRAELKELLFGLAESQSLLSKPEEVKEICCKLELIYCAPGKKDNFRHYYSDIFAVLCQIDRDSHLGNTEILSQNMNLIRLRYRPQNMGSETGKYIDISKEINKLYDHINLDIARINYSKAIEMRSNEKLQQLNDTVSKMEENIEKADDLQKQYITILGIFASIVLAFTGGIAFSTSVLENISAASIYRVALVVIGLAFTLLNVIYLLTRFILEIHKKSGEVISYPVFMKILNGLFIGMFFLVLISWLFDIKRAAEIFRNYIY